MTARIFILEPASTEKLRARFRASLVADTDDIEFVGAIDEGCAELRRLSTDIGFMIAAGDHLHLGTIERLETIASRLLQTAQAERLARQL